PSALTASVASVLGSAGQHWPVGDGERAMTRPAWLRSAIPPSASAILLDIAIVASRTSLSLPQIELLHIAMAAQAIARDGKDEAPILHDIAVIGDCKGHGRALLDQENGNRELFAHLQEPPRQILNHDRSETKRELVDQQELRIADESAR